MTVRKILHAADIHLDSPLQKLEAYENAPVDQIRGASRRALENLVRCAIAESVDLVVIAGDLYDGDWTDQNTGLFFVSQAAELVRAGIPMVVIRGNHDAANVMTSSLPLPHNPDGSEIMLSCEQVDRRIFDSIGIAVHGRSFRSRAETENLAASYPPPINGLFNIGLLHTSLTGAEGHDSYAPCTPTQLIDKRYDYWALGHVHTRARHGSDDDPPIIFSGNLQGRHIRETGPKGCVLVEIDPRGGCQTTFRPLDVVRWERCRIDISDRVHLDEILDAYQAWLYDQLRDLDERLLVVRVEIVGRSPLHTELHRRGVNLKSSLRAATINHGGGYAWLEAVRLNSQPPDDGFTIVDLDGPAESLAHVVGKLRQDPQSPAILRDEVSALLNKLPPEVGDDPLPLEDTEWLQRLIDSAAAEVAAALRMQDPTE